MLRDTGRCAEAEGPLREALAIRQAGLPPESADIATARSYLGLCLVELGRPEEGEPLLREALPVVEARRGPEAELVREVRGALGGS